ncbi:hypothetical protein OTU49_007444 [Cherax quadricarinatus]|uniref:non-specific serine/threonine protein kinase n=1 Tax=Cherax quadricarinatus TaxID=27406 RepID=A0AAW0WW74_CHEQU
MWSVRAVVERALQYGRQALQRAQGIHNQVQLQQPQQRAPNSRHKLSKWQSEGGAGAGKNAAECGSESQASASIGTGPSVASSVVSRLAQSLVRKVSAPLWAEAKRSATKRLVFGESAPYFALVGVTLVSGSQLGLVTKEDELENLCCNIREAISRAGWLHNPEYWQHQKDLKDGQEESFDVLETEHTFTLNDFVLGPAIDKGCSAVVYAARWNADEPQEKTVTSQPLKRQRSRSPVRPAEDLEEDDQAKHKNSLLPITETLHFLADQDGSQRNLDHEYSLRDFGKIDIQELNVNLEEENLIAESTQVPEDHTKKVKFKIDETKTGDNMKRTLTLESAEGGTASSCTTLAESVDKEESLNIPEYPLAVKMMFNYEAESNAPAILRAMYKEMIPARSLQLDGEQLEWQERFCSKHMNLPPHPNIVEMPCVFVDSIPFLKDSMQLYPDALPTRINPSGYGRNMSLFCVMKRYDMSLRDYLTQHKPPGHTSLLLLTQLLEAVLHINNHNVAHRDLKTDNILLSLSEGWQYPLLVVTDFGCSITTDSSSMTVPFPSREADPRQGNVALMAPEVKTATPGLLRSVNFTLSDLWAVGALAYEIYGLENPFCSTHQNTSGSKQKYLDSATYRESQLPRLPKCVPASVKHLIHDLLRRNPRNRPSVNIAATLCQLILWAPSKWLSRHALSLPTHTEIMQWLLCLTTKVLCEARLSRTQRTDGKKNVGQRRRMEEMRGASSERQGGQLEYELVSTFLARVHYMDIIQAIKWNRAF